MIFFFPDVKGESSTATEPECNTEANEVENTPSLSASDNSSDKEPSTSSPDTQPDVTPPDNDPNLPADSSESQGAISKTLEDINQGHSEVGVEIGKDVAEASPSTSTTPADEKTTTQSEYHVKWIKFKNKSHGIITQNENGPCPLLAIINVLILGGRIKIPPMVQVITSEQLMDYLANCIIENTPKVYAILTTCL